MNIWIASDHAGFALKEELKKEFLLHDLGCENEESCDYPLFAHRLCSQMEEDDKGILICGTGIGMSITANRYKNIRAALCLTPEMAQLARQHNDANVLVLGARIIDTQTANACVKTFLSVNFEKGRHRRRINLINIPIE